jgi:hypothetical protein
VLLEERSEIFSQPITYFGYRVLRLCDEEHVTACDHATRSIEKRVKEKLKSEETLACADSVFVSKGDPQTIEVTEGQIVYIVSATLAGKMQNAPLSSSSVG